MSRDLDPAEHRFGVLIPVKPWARAKSRLDIEPPAMRPTLVRALAEDVVDAVLGCAFVEQVRLVASGPGLVREDPRFLVVPDEGGGDLNVALVRAADALAREHPGLGVVVVLADLPCLRAADLDDVLGVLRGVSAGRWFVADAEGTGTSLLAAAPGVPLDPSFGAGSARLHETGGATPIRGSLATLRRDVDTEADLRTARALGVGPHTAHALRP